jgi:hypothetical protein
LTTLPFSFLKIAIYFLLEFVDGLIITFII